MLRFLARRGLTAVGILLVLSVMMYAMLNLALDPLDDLRESTALNKAELIEARIRLLRLDEPWYTRYVDWLGNFVTGDFGMAWRTGQHVNDLLVGAIATSVQLVFASTIIAILLGCTIGLISALRQYTTFDYAITFVSFVLYSLPVFWVAVLLKQFVAIGFNDFLANPTLNWVVLFALSIVAGLFWAGAIGGDRRRRLIVFATAALVTLAVSAYVLTSGWFNAPQLGVVGVAVLGVAAALGVTAIFSGIANRRALYSALTTAAVGVASYYAVQWLFFFYVPNNAMMVGLLALAIVVALAIGWLFGGPDRGVSMRGATIVAIVMSVGIFVDRVLATWTVYVNAPSISGRPIATIGSETPNLNATYFVSHLDRFTHLLLPTLALVLISFASYTRYQRGATLEVLNQDYIRTARAKGLPERVVIVRHALRNALLPLASVIPLDLISLIGGAVITETIFGWSGMGKMFIDSMNTSQIDPVMAYVMIVGVIAMVANLIADFLYAVLDPRIRVNA